MSIVLGYAVWIYAHFTTLAALSGVSQKCRAQRKKQTAKVTSRGRGHGGRAPTGVVGGGKKVMSRVAGWSINDIIESDNVRRL